MAKFRELLLGCGSRVHKDIVLAGHSPAFKNVTTLDNNADHKPDLVWDLTSKRKLPFRANTFDEIHAYEVLEHLAYQGDYKFFFKEFSEYWRILRPGGLFFASVPSVTSRWCFGDPSHKRVIQPESLIFLDQKQYEKQVGKTPMSDFRCIYKADFTVVSMNDEHGKFSFILKAVK